LTEYEFIVVANDDDINQDLQVADDTINEQEEIMAVSPEIKTIPPLKPVDWKKTLKTPTIVQDKPLKNCCMCKKSFDLEKNLMEHAREDHKVKPSATKGDSIINKGVMVDCKICLKAFRSRVALKNHQTNHSNLVTCPICGIRTTKQSSFAHNRLHNSVTVECEICHKMLKSQSGLAEHKKKLHGDELFECGCCSKVFANKIYLNRHMVW
jgi:hypothetical protein